MRQRSAHYLLLKVVKAKCNPSNFGNEVEKFPGVKRYLQKNDSEEGRIELYNRGDENPGN